MKRHLVCFLSLSVLLLLTGCRPPSPTKPNAETDAPSTEAQDTAPQTDTVRAETVDLSEAALREKFPAYYDLGAFKGLEVYVWESGEQTYRCGVLSGTNRLKTEEELNELKANGATVEEMKAILSSYDTEKENIIILPIDIQSTADGINDLQALRALFDD